MAWCWSWSTFILFKRNWSYQIPMDLWVKVCYPQLYHRWMLRLRMCSKSKQVLPVNSRALSDTYTCPVVSNRKQGAECDTMTAIWYYQKEFSNLSLNKTTVWILNWSGLKAQGPEYLGASGFETVNEIASYNVGLSWQHLQKTTRYGS